MNLGEKNVGKIDRALRALFGLGFLWWQTGLAAPASYVALIIGIVLLLTGLVGSCPLYSVLGISTVGSKWCDLPPKK